MPGHFYLIQRLSLGKTPLRNANLSPEMREVEQLTKVHGQSHYSVMDI